MSQQTITLLKRIAATGAISVFAGSIASAGWLCNWQTQHARPYYNPSCEPNWGFHETDWRRISSSLNSQQGSYCPDGSCQSGISDTTYQDALQLGGLPQGVPTQQAIVQPAPYGQAIILPQQQPNYPSLPMQDQPGYPSTGGNPPVFNPPIAPNDSHQMQPMNVPPSGDYQHYSPGYSGGTGAPIPMPGAAPGVGDTSTLSPLPQQPANPGDIPLPTPMPMQDLPQPMPMPPMPNQTSYYQSPMHNVSQQQTYYGNNMQYSAQQQFAPNPQQGPPAMPQPIPVKGISYGRTVDQPAAAPANAGQPAVAPEANPTRFSLIPRIWTRGH